MFEINVKSELDKLQESLKSAADQLPFANAKAITDTAFDVRKAEIKEMEQVFQNPIPFTLKSVLVEKATKKDLTAKVYINNKVMKGNAAEKFLSAEIQGGERRAKAFERALMAAGLIPSGYYAVPGEGADIDAAGNMRRSQIVAVIKAVKKQVQEKTSSTRRKKARPTEYFIGRPGKAPLGIWKHVIKGDRVGITPIIIFVRQPIYKKRFDFYEVARTVTNRNLVNNFNRALDYALSTRK